MPYAETEMAEVHPPEPQDDGTTRHTNPEDVWDHIDIAMVRPRFEWIDTAEGVWPVVQLGAGSKQIRSAYNIDYPTWDVHSDDPLKWMLDFDNDSVGHVYSYHTFDHFEPRAVVRALCEVQRVLRPGGTFTHIVPHYLGQLANECLMHRSRFAIDTFRNIFSERQYSHEADGVTGPRGGWQFDIGANFIYGQTERNLVLVTQLVKRVPDDDPNT